MKRLTGQKQLHWVILLALVVVLITPAFSTVTAQEASNGITAPAPGSVLRGVVSVQGVATHASFLKWQLDLLLDGNDSQANFLALGEQPVPQPAALFQWDTTPFPDGKHSLRLRVVRSDTNYDEYFTPITIANATPAGAAGPTLLATTPADGASWDGGPVSFAFDKAISTAEVLVSPSLAGATSLDGEQVIFTPEGAPTAGVRYLFTVAQAQAADGSALTSAPQITLQMVGPLAVANTQPQDGASEADPNSPILVIFNKPAVALVGIEDQATLPQPLTMEPAVEGEGEWISTTIYQFRPSKPLGGGVTYQATVDPLSNAAGESMAAPYTFQFTVAAPIVLGIKPEGIFVPPTAPTVVTFSQPMAPASTEAAFALTVQDGTATAGAFAWDAAGAVMTFTPASALTYGVAYTAAVATAAQPASQQGNLRDAYSSSFTVVPLPAVASASILDEAAGVNPETDLRIRFTAPVSEATVIGNIRVEPILSTTQVISFTYSDYYENTNQNQTTINTVIPPGYDTHMSLNWRREPNTAYTVTIGGGVADPFGNTMGDAYELNFTTGDYDPLLELKLDRFTHFTADSEPIVGVRYRNVDEIDAELLKLPLPDLYLLGGQNGWSLWDDYEVPNRDENLIWEKSVPADGEPNVVNLQGFRLVDAEGNPLPPGVYLFQLRNPLAGKTTPSYSEQPEMLKAVIVLSNYNITLKRATGGASLAWVTGLRSGQPIPDAPVLFSQENQERGQAVTGADGLAVADLALTLEQQNAPVFATSGAPGQPDFAVVSSDWDDGIEPWAWGIPTGSAYSQAMIELYSDRPIYRPGNTINWKGIVRVQEGDQWGLPTAGTPVRVTINDTLGNRVLDREYKTNAYGTINGSFTLAPDAPTGYYSLNAELPLAEGVTAYGSVGVQVAAYVKPEFQIEVTTDKPEYVQGETIVAMVQANYFSGGPLVGAPVEWRLVASPYSFTWADAPDGRYYSFDPFDPEMVDYDPYSSPSNFYGLIQEGRGQTDENGAFVIEVPAELGNAIASQRWSLDVVTTSPTQQQVYNSVSFPVHRGAYYIGLSPQSYVATVGEPANVDAVTVTPDGKPYPDAALEAVVYEFAWNNVYEQAEDGNYYWKSTVERTPVFTSSVNTDGEGNGVITFTPAKGGQYQVTATGTDSAGNRIASATFLYATSDAGEYVAWPQENNDRIELIADKKLYAPGETARILVPNPYTGTVQALVTVERNGVLQSQVTEFDGSSPTLEILVTGDYIPNVYVGVVIVKGIDDTNPFPSTRVGYVKLAVDTSAKALTIAIAPSAATLQPRDLITYTLTVKDSAGNPAPDAELSLALVDKAVLVLGAGVQAETPLIDRFYYERPLGVTTGSLIVINKDRVSQQLAEGGKGGGGGGGGPEGPTVREEFPDTAYWRADAVSDANGEIVFSLALPDNLTTWVLTAKGVTADTKVGEASNEVVVTKDLQVRPGLPRFFTSGDKATIGGVVINTTAAPVEGVFALEISGATLETDQTEQAFTAEPNIPATFAFPIAVDPTATTVIVTMTAVAGDLSDGVKIALPVLKYSTPETVGTSGMVPPEGLTEALYVPDEATDDGALSIQLQPSLAAGLADGLTYLEHYPYECNEQTTSRFLPNLFTVQALRELGIEDPVLESNLSYQLGIGVQQLISRQNPDGGWGYWPQQQSTPFITTYVLWGLWNANEMGYKVDSSVFDRAATYLDGQFQAPDEVTQDWMLNEMAFMHYVLAEIGRGDAGRMSTLYAVRERMASYGIAFLAMAMDLVDPDDARVQTLLDNLLGSAVLTAAGASWQDQTVDYQTMGSNTRSTAIVLAAFLQIAPEQPILPNVVRWLMDAREAGRWASTQENAWSIISLTDWMAYTGELNADFAWQVELNEEELGAGRFTDPKEQVILRQAVADLLRDEANLLRFSRSAEPGQLYYTTYLQYYLDALEVEPLARGIAVERRFEKDGKPVERVRVGDVFSVTLTLIAPSDLFHVLASAPIPAGVAALDPNLPTGFQYDQTGQPMLKSEGGSDNWYNWTPSYVDYRDDRVTIFATYLPAGTYSFTFQARAAIPGEFRVLPAFGEMMYFPEVWGRGGGQLFVVE